MSAESQASSAADGCRPSDVGYEHGSDTGSARSLMLASSASEYDMLISSVISSMKEASLTATRTADASGETSAQSETESVAPDDSASLTGRSDGQTSGSIVSQAVSSLLNSLDSTLFSLSDSASYVSHGPLGSTAYASPPLSQSDASSILSDFSNDTGLFSLSASASSHDSSPRQLKLLLWQALLIRFGVCAIEPGQELDTTRPTHFPSPPLPLPTSLNGCNKLLKTYVFVNIRDYMANASGTNAEGCQLFQSASALARYTKKNRRYIRLPRAKEGYLTPLLRKIVFKPRLHSIDEAADSA